MELVDQEFPLFSLKEIDVHGAEIPRVTDPFEKIQRSISGVAVSSLPGPTPKPLFVRKLLMDEVGLSDLDSSPLMLDLDGFLEVDIIKLNIVKKGIGDPQRATSPFNKSFESQTGAGKNPVDEVLGRSFVFDHAHTSPATSKVGLEKEREAGIAIDESQSVFPVIEDMRGRMGDVMDPQPVEKDTLVLIEHDLPERGVDDTLHLTFKEKNALIEHLFEDHPPGRGAAEKGAARALFETLYPAVGDDVDDPVGNIKRFAGADIIFMKAVGLFEDSKHDVLIVHFSSFLS